MVYSGVMGKAERTRAAIIEQTAPLFNRRGYAGTSLSDLTEEIQLTKGAIYGNFTDKQELALEALKFNISHIAGEIRTRQAAANSHIDRLMAYPEAYRSIYRWILGNGGCPIANTLTEADDTNPALSRLALLFVRRWRRNIDQIVRAGQAEGELRDDADGDRLGQALLAAISGGVMLAKATGDHSFIRTALEQASAMVEQTRVGE
ncbi:MAG: TetR/AcrR family transcriptional regulator [bacterium]|nr:TetR/AcrR family transcriptional regulator [bacterium]